MFRPRSYMAFAIIPRVPIVDWLADLDAGLIGPRSFSTARRWRLICRR
jgi:hypothetical protein